MKKYFLLLLIGLCAASCDSYEFSHLESLLDEAWEEYNPYLWDVYKSYSMEERRDYEVNPDSIPFVTEKGDTIMVWPLASRNNGEMLINRRRMFGEGSMCLVLYQDAELYKLLIDMGIKWYKRDKKMELTVALKDLYIFGCNSSSHDYVEKRYDDYLEFGNDAGDVFLFQKNVGIVRITCHDGRSWTPVR